jgi:hypothetical protein
LEQPAPAMTVASKAAAGETGAESNAALDLRLSATRARLAVRVTEPSARHS